MDKRYNKTLKPVQIIVLGFAATILFGTVLLMLPFSTQEATNASFVDALFTATSAVCVTGLVVVDTGTYWSGVGQVIILLLIQIGGLGFMTMATSVAILLGKKIGLKNRLIMQEALNQFSIAGVIRLTQYVIFTTLFIEAIGAALLSFRFIPEFGLGKGIFFSIFHSISAFCNAGFDVMGGGTSLMAYIEDPLVTLVIVTLIILGGLGFAVIADLLKSSQINKFSLHSKLVIFMTVTLVSTGFFLVLFLEYNNPETLGNLSMRGKILGALFHSVTPRTAGFNTLDMNGLRLPTVIITMLYMFIGGSPGSTAGGIKTTTFGMVVLKVIAVVRGDEDVEFANRRIARDTINRALAIVFIASFIVIFVVFALSITETGADFKMIFFEAVSAFATVGLSLGLTPHLTLFGKIIISAAMFFGRLGPLTIVLAISNRKNNYKKLVRYPEGKIIVG
jgi:trk system potassium uptake protein TrkH